MWHKVHNLLRAPVLEVVLVQDRKTDSFRLGTPSAEDRTEEVIHFVSSNMYMLTINYPKLLSREY